MNSKTKALVSLIVWLISVVALLLLSGCSHTPYVKVGAGYKIQETDLYLTNSHESNKKGNHPVSARIDVGLENGAWSYGVSHHSQFFTGAPFNNDPEYGKTELFVDYKWEWR